MVRPRTGYPAPMYTLARFLQMVGLLVVPMALFYGMQGGDARGVAMRELTIVAAGAAAFILGRYLETKSAG